MAAASLDPLLLALSTLSSLESLQLGVSDDCTVETKLEPSSVASLAENCQNLSWLYMASFPLEDDHMCALFESIGTERREALKVLDFPQSDKLTIESWKALWELLKINPSLESVNMYAPPWAKQAKELIYSFLALNRDGKRQKLRQCRNVEAWIQIAHKLTTAGRDLNVLYTIVRENPLVCSL